MLNLIRKIQRRLTEGDHKEVLWLIMKQLDPQMSANLLDLGCGDGSKTALFSMKCNTQNVYGIEIIEKYIRAAKQKGIKVIRCNI